MSRGEALNESYPAVPEAVPLARRALAALAAAAGAAGERLDEIRLAVSEALTNAVLHAYRNGEAGGCTSPRRSPRRAVGTDRRRRPRPARWNDSQGLGIGLSLISGLSDDFAIVTRASGGTEVQMRFDLRTAAQSRGSRSVARRA